ncbi:FecR family protein [Maribellus luteus]|uniref:FecR family protein n=1 Tax=Maribellus luteus TaxID=2305463 RepID=A0A399T8L7_9BACT|nr:FecR family protein [Maribellus luteus]RIJ50547.1 FecR family protein [Maribellus luteus]
MNNEKDYILLNKYLSNETTEFENKQFLDWLNNDPENIVLFNQCKDIYLSVGIQHINSRYNKEKIWQELKSLTKITRKKNTNAAYVNFFKIAAIIVMILLTAFLINSISNRNQSVPWYEVQASMGSTSRILLADSSIVWLNAGSKLKLAPDFNQKSRRVYLSGEAFFDVKKNKKQHFIVHTSNIFIKVLGTQFNIKSYPDDNIIETTLKEGSIQIFDTKNADKQLLTLEPNQKASYIKEKGKILTSDIKKEITEIQNKNEVIEYRKANIIIASHVNTSHYTSWKEGQLIFKNESLEKIIKVLERKYNVTIVSDNKHVNQIKITANFKNESIEQVMFALQLTASFKYSIDKNTIYIQGITNE